MAEKASSTKFTVKRIFRIVVLGLILILLLVLFILSRGGIPGQYAVIDGHVFGYLDVNDGLVRGSHTLYTESVLDMGFCAKDQAVMDKALKFANRHLHVNISYRSINQGDLPAYGCEPRPESDQIKIYLLTDLNLSLAGEMENILLEQVLDLPHDSFYEAPGANG